MAYLLLRGLGAGVVVIAATLAARKGSPALAGLIVTFPIITIISAASVASDRGTKGMNALLAGNVKALPVWFAFIVPTYLLSRIYPWGIALALGVGVWLVGACLYLWLTGALRA